jgi:hypothetical protein
MAVRRLYVVISVIVVFAFLFALFIFVISPPSAPSEVLIKSGFTNWSVENEPVVHGETIWSTFADYDRDQTIKLGYEAYLGGLNLNTEYMSWEAQDGSYSTNSLTFDDLMNRWQDSESVFKFKHEETFFRVSFSIPQQENGAPKYPSLEEAWANKELYQTIEIW